MKKYILLLTLFCPLLVLAQTENPKSLPSDSLSTTLHAEQLMAKDTLSVPLPAPVPQHYLYSPFDMYGITPFNYGYTTWELHKGFNASIGMNVTFSPSKYAFRSGFRSGCRFLVRRTAEQALQRSRRIVCQQLQLGWHQLPQCRNYRHCCV